jgi:toxin ParE1/3/4
MAGYKLNDAAKDDIKRIYQRGVTEFGEAQADIYYAALFDRFDSVAARPYLYPAVDHIRDGYRRSVCGVDSIYYRILGAEVEIMRVLGRQDLTELGKQ